MTKPKTVEVPRAAVQGLVDSLADEWWVKAADALAQLRAALDAPTPDPAARPDLRGFGTQP